MSIAKEQGPAGPGSVLVLPTRTPMMSAVDGGAFDLLLATAFQDLAFDVVDPAALLEASARDVPSLEEARAAYLDMRLEDALRLVRQIRQGHLDYRGDLLLDPLLLEAELFMVQVLMDLGHEEEAAEVASAILEGSPRIRLDPAEYAPQVQALWAAVVESRAGAAVTVPRVEELHELAVRSGVDWLAQAALAGEGAQGPRLLLRLVPTMPGEEASDHFATLGSTATWGSAVRKMLLERFPPAPPTAPAAVSPFGPAGPPDGVETDLAPWYRRWWFWTAVGVVLVGATAGAVGGYYAGKDPGDPKVTADFQW